MSEEKQELVQWQNLCTWNFRTPLSFITIDSYHGWLGWAAFCHQFPNRKHKHGHVSLRAFLSLSSFVVRRLLSNRFLSLHKRWDLRCKIKNKQTIEQGNFKALWPTHPRTMLEVEGLDPPYPLFSSDKFLSSAGRLPCLIPPEKVSQSPKGTGKEAGAWGAQAAVQGHWRLAQAKEVMTWVGGCLHNSPGYWVDSCSCLEKQLGFMWNGIDCEGLSRSSCSGEL